MKIEVIRHHVNKTGRVVRSVGTTMETLKGALSYHAMLLGTIERQGGGSIAGLYVNGIAIPVNDGVPDPASLAKATAGMT